MANLTRLLGFFGFLVTSLLIGLPGCAKGFNYEISPPNQGVAVAKKEFFSGTVTSTDRSVVDLASYKGLPLIVIFAQDTCTVCHEEVQEFIRSLADHTREPSKVKLLNILVGAAIEDAADWKDTNTVPWTVAVDTGDSLFTRYCGGGKVPCTVVQLPKDGIVHKKVGANTSSEIKAITGDWEN